MISSRSYLISLNLLNVISKIWTRPLKENHTGQKIYACFTAMIALFCRTTLCYVFLCESGKLALGESAYCYLKFPKVCKCI